MNLSADNSVAELRNELERKRRKAQELQMDTTDSEEWESMNMLRWELEDLDKDLYSCQFIRNNDRISRLTGQLTEAGADAVKVLKTIEEVERAITNARGKLKDTSRMFGEISGYLDDVSNMLGVIKS